MLAFLKYLPFLAKLGSLGSWFTPLAGLIPGGQIGLIISAVINGIIKFVTWVVEDIIDLFTKPKRFALVACLVLAGAWLAADWYREKINDLKSDLAEKSEALEKEQVVTKAWESRYADEQQRAAAAVKARDDAAEQIKQAAIQAAAEAAARKRAADAKRVRDGTGGGAAKAGPENAATTGVWSFPALPWSTK